MSALTKKVISIASDHAGYRLKEQLKELLQEDNYEIIDRGTFGYDSVDYPDYAEKVCRDVLEKKVDFGILICGTGIGMSIAANKIKGIRAALCFCPELARLARTHNDSNVLVLPGRFIAPEFAKMIVNVFSESEFEGGRHERRLRKISELEESGDENDKGDLQS